MAKRPKDNQTSTSRTPNVGRRDLLLSGGSLLALSATGAGSTQAQQARSTPTPTAATGKPNILVIWGDDIGTWNISHNNRGMMGYSTPNIDRIAKEGVSFTDYYGQQSCTAGRAAFLGGNVPVRTGMTKVGLPGAKEGWQKTDVTVATVMKSLGYATGQFGKNHQGDRDEHLPTMHGFDEFFGNLYHLNAEEEPENRDYPKDPEFRKKFGPRGVIQCKADRQGRQTIEDTGPLTKKRMETIDEETLGRRQGLHQRQHEGRQAVLLLVERHAHALPHPREDSAQGLGRPRRDEYHDGMVEHDMPRRRAAEAARRPRHRRQHDRLLLDRQRPALQHLARRRHHAVPQREELELGGRLSRAGLRPLAGQVPGQDDAQRHRRARGLAADVRRRRGRCRTSRTSSRPGVELNGRKYKNYIDGHNQLDYLSGKAKESPRKEFIYVNDDGQIVAIRYDDWKAVFLENRGQAFGVWREPFTELRVPLLFNLRRDPVRAGAAQSNTYNDWFLDRSFVLVPMQRMAAKFLMTMKDYPPSQTPGSFNLSAVEEKLRRSLGSP